MITIRRRGFPEATKILTEAMPEKQMVRVVRDVTSRLTRFVASINPVDTGAMRGSWAWVTVGLMGQAYISLSAVNPRSLIPVSQYAPIVDEWSGIVDASLAEGGRIMVEALEAVTWEPRG